MKMKNTLFAGLTAVFLLPALATEIALRQPVVVAESEAFEIVGRLEQNGLLLHVDRAPTNVPVLDASLTVELAGKEIAAHFRPATGDYLIDDADWLQAVRVTGEHGLSFTLLAGEESDLLAGDLLVEAGLTIAHPSPALLSPLVGGLVLGGLGLLAALWGWRRLIMRRGGVA